MSPVTINHNHSLNYKILILEALSHPSYKR